MHLRSKQYASAFQHLSASVNLNSSFPPSFMLLGVALMHLNDYTNAINSLNRAAELDTYATIIRRIVSSILALEFSMDGAIGREMIAD